jgi:hypothetical protein
MVNSGSNLFCSRSDFVLEGIVKKLPQVEAAKSLLIEAMKWSVMKWLREKKTVRKTADRANAALDQLSLQLRQGWPQKVRAAYEALVAQSAGNDPAKPRGHNGTYCVAKADALLAKKIKDADDEAYRARMNAEEAFDAAEKRLSTRLAREGCLKAIRAWELQEQAIQESASICLSGAVQVGHIHS